MKGEKFPEHEKLKKIKDKSQVIGDFMSWLNDIKKLYLCTCTDVAELDGQDDYGDLEEVFWPAHRDVTKLLGEYFDIDLNKLEKEKVKMLDQIRDGNK